MSAVMFQFHWLYPHPHLALPRGCAALPGKARFWPVNQINVGVYVVGRGRGTGGNNTMGPAPDYPSSISE